MVNLKKKRGVNFVVSQNTPKPQQHVCKTSTQFSSAVNTLDLSTTQKNNTQTNKKQTHRQKTLCCSIPLPAKTHTHEIQTKNHQDKHTHTHTHTHTTTTISHSKQMKIWPPTRVTSGAATNRCAQGSQEEAWSSWSLAVSGTVWRVPQPLVHQATCNRMMSVSKTGEKENTEEKKTYTKKGEKEGRGRRNE